MRNNKIAIIGTGIAGLTCGYELTKRGFDLTVYEAADYIGGHTNTVDVDVEGEASRIDTGFIVFNDRTYPNFINLLEELNVQYQPTDMSFSVRNDHIDLEYNGHNLNSLFAQRSNLISPRFYNMLHDIIRFNKDVRAVAEHDEVITIGEYLERSSYSELFKQNYLLPMISAIWSMGLESCQEFPLKFFVKFFENHGLLDIMNRPQWFTVVGGSSTYIEPLTASFHDHIKLNTPVTRVERKERTIAVHTDTDQQDYDQVIFACHGDQALKMLQQPSEKEQLVLEQFKFSDNQVVLHTDESHLPRARNAWACWNYRMVDSAREQTALTYNMNILQRLQKNNTYLVTLNQDIDKQKVIRSFNYSHPIYSNGMIGSQGRWQEISGVDRIHYCGAYWFNGFHEDGVRSGLRVSTMVGAQS